MYGRESVADLKSLVTAKFSAVVDKGLASPHFSGDVMLAGQKPRLLKVVLPKLVTLSPQDWTEIIHLKLSGLIQYTARGFMSWILQVVPQKQTDSLVLQWPIEPQCGLYESLPTAYVSHLLGYAPPTTHELRPLLPSPPLPH